MHDKEIYVTINHLDDFGGLSNLRVGNELFLKKDRDNPYDDEAIAVCDGSDVRIGYVANSTCTVARGTYSAGRLYDLLKDKGRCTVGFILGDAVIARYNGQGE